VTLTRTAADTSNQNKFTATGNDLLIFENTSADTAYTVTITSENDKYGRSGDITTEAIGSGVIKFYGPMKVHGWRDSAGVINCEASNANVKIAVIALP